MFLINCVCKCLFNFFFFLEGVSSVSALSHSDAVFNFVFRHNKYQELTCFKEIPQLHYKQTKSIYLINILCARGVSAGASLCFVIYRPGVDSFPVTA